ncbi:MAG: hypothetical protein V7634_4719, partial [Bradyrhizobium sp.]
MRWEADDERRTSYYVDADPAR